MLTGVGLAVLGWLPEALAPSGRRKESVDEAGNRVIGYDTRDAEGNLLQQLSAIHDTEAIAAAPREELPTPEPAEEGATRPEDEDPRTFFLPAKLQAETIE